MYVCMYVRTYVCMYVYMHECGCSGGVGEVWLARYVVKMVVSRR